MTRSDRQIRRCIELVFLGSAHTRCPFRIRCLAKAVGYRAGSNLTRAEQIEPHSLRRRSGRTIRDQGEVRDFVKRNRRTVNNHVHERWLRCGTYTRLRFIGACGNPAAVRGHLRRTRGTFALTALHAIHRRRVSEPACWAKLDNQQAQQQNGDHSPHITDPILLSAIEQSQEI